MTHFKRTTSFISGLIVLMMTSSCAVSTGEVVYPLPKNRFLYMEGIKARTFGVSTICFLEERFQEIFEKLKGTKPGPVKKGGTGVVLRSTKDVSYILTAAHVVDGNFLMQCSMITVNSNDGKRRYVAKVVKSSKADDIALLEVKGNLGYGTTVAKSSYVGQTIIAAGFPALDMFDEDVEKESVSISEGTLATNLTDANSELFRIRYTAPSYYGSSGGPVFDEGGNVVGIVSMMRGALGITGPRDTEFLPRDGNYYAVPYNLIRKLIKSSGVKTLEKM